MVIKISKLIDFQPPDYFHLEKQNNGLTPFANYCLNSPNDPFDKGKIRIKDKWFKIIHESELFRKRNSSDGYYRVIYIQINWLTNEYYIGKANRKTWLQLKRYQGSGIKFKNNFKKYEDNFTRYYVAVCKSAKETEELEASLVDDELLKDPKCLNLVRGGSGGSIHPTQEEIKLKQSAFMKAHPDRYKAMVETAKKYFTKGTPECAARCERIRSTMQDDKYKEMMRERILNWKKNNPEAYALSRKRNKERQQDPAIKAKRVENLKKYKREHPEEFKKWEENRINACKSKKSNEKRKRSLQKWKETHPEEVRQKTERLKKYTSETLSKSVCMINLKDGSVVRTFKSMADAGQWLRDQGLSKSINPQSSISAICLKKEIDGHGLKSVAYGYGWCFAEEVDKNRYIGGRFYKQKHYITEIPLLMKEWDYEQNQTVDPKNITIRSNKKIHWLCSHCHHKWIATVDKRVTRGDGCPKCHHQRKLNKSSPKQLEFDFKKERVFSPGEKT